MARFIRFSFHRLCLIFSLLFLTVGCDQVTKVLARDVLADQRSFSYLNQLIQIEHAENPGAFLSLGATLDSELRFWIFTLAVAVFLGISLILLLKKNSLDKLSTLGMTLLIGGGFGNLIDRIAKGTVTDFIIMGQGIWRTGIFNFADIAIVAGVLILMFKSIRLKEYSR